MSTLRIAGGQALRLDTTVEDTNVLMDRDKETVLDIGAGLDADADEASDAAGCLVTPGLVNAHRHVTMMLLCGYANNRPLDAWLREDIWPAEGALMSEDVRADAELGLVEVTKSGITGFVDIYFHVPEIAAAVEEAGLHAHLDHGVVTLRKDDADARASIGESPNMAREFDGATDDRIRTTTMPHLLMTVMEEYLRELVADVHDEDIPAHYHASKTTDEVDPVVDKHGERPLPHAKGLGMLTADDFLVHGVYVDNAEIDLLVDTGTGIIHCPASNMKLALSMTPAQGLLNTGITVGLGTDGAASNDDLNMLGEIRDVAMLGKLAAEDVSAVAASDVIRMAIAGSITAVDPPGGALEADGIADLVVVDPDASHLMPANDLVSHLVCAVRGSDIYHAVCDGRVLMRDREVLTFGEDAVMARAHEAIAPLRERI